MCRRDHLSLLLPLLRRDRLADARLLATGISGSKIVAPAILGDGRGLLKAAIRDENPVAFLEQSASTR